MKVIIQIPCFNEAETLGDVIKDLPKQIDNIDTVEYLVIDDGSTDNTSEVAKELGVHHILRLGSNRGLATTFARGIDYALKKGADIVVNTDGDNQYCGQDIPKLIVPILANQADMVVGCRPILEHPEFGTTKKILQLLGSKTLRWISQTKVRDAASGFRAFSRETCQKLFIHSRFSYCMETLIQAGNSGLRVASVDIRVNKKTRSSRLFRNVPEYIWKSSSTMLSMFALYRPGKFFSTIGMFFELVALLLGCRFIYLSYITTTPEPGRTYLPSLVLLAMCSLFGALLFFMGVLGEIVKSQRRLHEETLSMIRKKEQQ